MTLGATVLIPVSISGTMNYNTNCKKINTFTMNKRNLSILIAAATASVLVCCSKQNETDPKIPENGDGQFQSLELTSVKESEFQSKAVVDGETFPQDGHIGLFLFADAAASQTYGEGFENVDYSYNSQKGKWTANPSIKVGSTPGYLYGYYPYDSEATDVKAIPVESSLNGDDVMYASKQAEPITDATAANTAITMNHALARVSIKVINKGYTGLAKLSSIKFADAKTSLSGSLDATTGTISGTTRADVTLTVPSVNQTITSDGTTYECLLVPSGEDESKQAVDLTLTIDGEDKTAKLSGDNGVIIAQNTKSNITITLSNKGISVQTVSVKDWNVVEVGGYKVTIAVAEGVDPNDILTKAYVDGNNVIIKASSFQSKRLICNVGGDAQCERVVTNDKFTFTISEISSDIEAVLGYVLVVTLTVTSDSNGKVWIGDDKNKTNGQFEQGEQVVIHAAPNDNFRFFRWNDNNRESGRTITVGATDVTYSASFISSDLIPGLFTVAVDEQGQPTKVVRFSKGNLWYGPKTTGATATFNFEANQYDTTPSSNGHRDENHISHFMWCDDADNAMALKYESGWDGLNKTFFAAKNFTVNGYSGWSVLTGGNNGEWNYLLNSRNTAYSDNHRYAGVMVNGMAGLLIFPDDFSSWPSGAGDEPQTFNTTSENWNGRNYTVEQFTVLQNNGCVFLPAAGCHNDYADDDTSVINVGRCFYWSASSCGTENAYDLFLSEIMVQPNSYVRRCNAESVRLVTEVK